MKVSGSKVFWKLFQADGTRLPRAVNIYNNLKCIVRS